MTRGRHAAHELGSFNLALAIAFAVGAIRPELAAGLAWPCAIAAAGLTGTAVIDLIGGQTPGADEAQHLVAVAGALLLVWQARTNGGKLAGGAAEASGSEANPGPACRRGPGRDATPPPWRTARRTSPAAARRPWHRCLPSPAAPRTARPGPAARRQRNAGGKGGTEAVA